MFTHVTETSLIKHYSGWTKKWTIFEVVTSVCDDTERHSIRQCVHTFIRSKTDFKYSLHAFSENSTALKITIHLSCNLAAYLCSRTAKFIPT